MSSHICLNKNLFTVRLDIVKKFIEYLNQTMMSVKRKATNGLTSSEPTKHHHGDLSVGEVCNVPLDPRLSSGEQTVELMARLILGQQKQIENQQKQIEHLTQIIEGMNISHPPQFRGPCSYIS